MPILIALIVISFLATGFLLFSIWKNMNVRKEVGGKNYSNEVDKKLNSWELIQMI